MSSISAVLIVKDEEKRLESCLNSLAWVDEIVIVDSGSRDRTREIAQKYTPRVYERPFDNFSNQKNFGIGEARGEWIFSVDADEVVTPELARFLRSAADRGTDLDGYFVDRVNFAFGKRIRSSGRKTEKILRFFRSSRGRFEQPIHERVLVRGRVGGACGELLHFSLESMEEYFKKLNQYTDFEAHWMAEKGIRPNILNFTFFPWARFVYFYFFRLGFLDGFEGFLYHCLSSIYYFLKFVKLNEICREKVEGHKSESPCCHSKLQR